MVKIVHEAFVSGSCILMKVSTALEVKVPYFYGLWQEKKKKRLGCEGCLNKAALAHLFTHNLKAKKFHLPQGRTTGAFVSTTGIALDAKALASIIGEN